MTIPKFGLETKNPLRGGLKLHAWRISVEKSNYEIANDILCTTSGSFRSTNEVGKLEHPQKES